MSCIFLGILFELKFTGLLSEEGRGRRDSNRGGGKKKEEWREEERKEEERREERKMEEEMREEERREEERREEDRGKKRGKEVFYVFCNLLLTSKVHMIC